jgi:hypothetical protein
MTLNAIRNWMCEKFCHRRIVNADEMAARLACTDVDLRQANYLIDRQAEDIAELESRIKELEARNQ